MIVKILKGLKNIVSPNYWAERIGEKSGAYDKARESKLATWASNFLQLCASYFFAPNVSTFPTSVIDLGGNR